ncbi:hypothetical protein DMUE_0551 [Dictyocoela muelleri]|nr:hypothetical protein DMUE_0551 [Dictyocoela muelleri]
MDRRLKYWVEIVEIQGGFITYKILKPKSLSIAKIIDGERKDSVLSSKMTLKHKTDGFTNLRRDTVSLRGQCLGESFEVNMEIFQNSQRQYGQNRITVKKIYLFAIIDCFTSLRLQRVCFTSQKRNKKT